ncbi:MAG: ABC transporter permease [Deltaproteobacteria bacterium]|nr:ABC transporter permease [Deltaproteobacteria bacterium]
MNGAWRIAARNLARSRRRNLATGLAVAFGYAALLIVGGYVIRVDSYLRTSSVYLGHLGHVGVFKKDGLEQFLIKPSKYALTESDQELIRAELEHDPAVDMFGASLLGSGLVGNGCKTMPFVGYGVDLELEARIRSHPEVLEHARELSKPVKGQTLVEAKSVDGPVTLGVTLAHRLGKSRVHEEAPEPLLEAVDCMAPDAAQKISADANVQLASAAFDGSFTAVDGEVVGHLSTGVLATDGQTLWTSVETLQRLYDTDSITSFVVFLRDPGAAREYGQNLERRLTTRGLDVEVYDFEDEKMNPYYVGTVQFLFVMAGFILTVVTSVVTLSILNSMTMTILERAREIGTLRSLGFTRRQVTGLFVREAMILTLTGEVVGSVLGFLVATGVRLANVRFQPPAVARPIQLLFTPTLELAAGLAVGLLALAAIATFAATRRTVSSGIAELNTAVTG